MKGFENRFHVVAGEIGHQALQRLIVVVVEDGADPGIAVEVAVEMLAPALAALVNQRRIERIRAGVDPFAQMMAVGAGKGRFQKPPIFQGDDAPAHHLEHRVDAPEQAIGNHRVEALAVVVDHPPEVADIVLPALEQGLEDVAFVELGVAGQRNHAAWRILGRHQVLEAKIILRDRGEQSHPDTEADRSGREIDGFAVLGPRRVGLGAAERPKALQLVARLMPEQVLDGVEDGRCMRLDCDAILRAQHVEIERGHQGRQRGARRLVPADLEPVPVWAEMVGVVDHPSRQPQHLALERPETRELVLRLRLLLGTVFALQGLQHVRLLLQAASLADHDPKILAIRRQSISPAVLLPLTRQTRMLTLTDAGG